MPTPSGHTIAIPASKVMGTTVFNQNGEKIGVMQDVMLDKMSNNIMFAVVSFGGFLGVGTQYHAVPWSVLDYDKERGGYLVPFTYEQLAAAPAYSLDDLTSGDGQAARNASYDYYKVDPYWS